MLSAEAAAVCGASTASPSPGRTNRRTGYRHRDFDTRAGAIDVVIPKLRDGSCSPVWLLDRRKLAERTLTRPVAADCLVGQRGRARRWQDVDGDAFTLVVATPDQAQRLITQFDDRQQSPLF